MQLFPKNPNFFILYKALAAQALEASKLLTHIPFSNGIGKTVTKARVLEKKSDELFHKLQFEADSTFITPFDREDIHALGKSLNDILDLTENVIADIEVYKVGQNGKAFTSMAKKITRTVGEIGEIMRLLSFKGRHVAEMKKIIERIHAQENEGDLLIRDAISELFHGRKKDPVHLLKWSHIYQNLELIFDECEHTADIVTEIILKNY